MIPGPVAKVLVLSPYYGEEAGAYCGGLCIVRQPVEGSNGVMPLW